MEAALQRSGRGSVPVMGCREGDTASSPSGSDGGRCKTARIVRNEILSNVVDGKSAHPAISGCFFHLTVDEFNTFDDLRDELRGVGASVSRRRGQFEYHGERGYG